MKKRLSPEVNADLEEHFAQSQREKVFGEDLSAYKDAEVGELKERLHHDSLTGLLSREGFKEEISKLMGKKSGSGAILFIDIDDFKEINTKYGNPGGDEALRSISAALKETLRLKNKTRHPDILARWGGEEFVAFLPDADASTFLAALEKQFRKQKLENVVIRLKPVKRENTEERKVTFSGGISDFHPNENKNIEEQVKELLEAVDKTSKIVPQAKASGKDQILSVEN